MAKKKKESTAPDSNFKFLQEGIKKHPLYKVKGGRSAKAWDELQDKLVKCKKPLPGQLVTFDYENPIHKDELMYYDARPMTIMFNIVSTPEGQRVLGFNLHYYPPRMRYYIMNSIYKLFKDFFLSNWDDGSKTINKQFNYNFLIRELKKWDLDFGVRMYDPKLIKNLHQVPPAGFATAMFTEGIFQKRTRAFVMKHWDSWLKRQKK